MTLVVQEPTKQLRDDPVFRTECRDVEAPDVVRIQELGEPTLKPAEQTRLFVDDKVTAWREPDARRRKQMSCTPVVRDSGRWNAAGTVDGLELGERLRALLELLERFPERDSLMESTVEGSVLLQRIVEAARARVGKVCRWWIVERPSCMPNAPDLGPGFQYAPSRKEIAAGTMCRHSSGVLASWSTTAGAV